MLPRISAFVFYAAFSQAVMRAPSAFLLAILFIVCTDGIASADRVVLRGGGHSEVRWFALTDRSVDMVTVKGQTWSIVRDAVDIPETLAANGMAAGERFSPSWPREVPAKEPPPPPSVAPDEPRRFSPRIEPERVQLSEPTAPQEPTEDTVPQIALPTPFQPPTSSKRYRVALFVNGILGTESLQFNDRRSFELFREQAQIETGFRDAQSRGAEVGVFFMLKGPVGVAASFEMFRTDHDGSYSARLPHPFFYDTFREIDETRSGLSHEERTAHFALVVSKSFGQRLYLDLFAGPSLFDTRTEILTDFLYEEAFPFDDVLTLGPVIQIVEQRPVGFNIGTHATYRLFGALGLNINIRYSRARLRLERGDVGEMELDLGGLRLGAGLKFLFP